MSDKNLSFQEIILRLLNYWQDQGCLVRQPYNIQVGAGTMNPATALSVLGPEPWDVVYVEPSIRPDDGRFGDNPNRMQMFHQLQVILKPDPGNPVELYLASLEAIGVNPREHDIRFVEDNWESPALGAWGLGWEVWLDGQEITQFTYFQQAGGFNLDPVSVEITYGLDRIALALQNAESVWDLDYGAGINFGGMLLQAEIEHCEYYFNVADVDSLKQVYDVYENEAKRCLEAELVLPAHDYNLKCSHLFNVLDTRGAIGVTERANYFRRMRNIALEVSKLYVAQREKLDFPLLNKTEKKVPPAQPAYQFSQMENPHTFLLELGVEELPVADLESAIEQLEAQVPALLNDLRLIHEKVSVYGTPRRLAVIVEGLHGRQTDMESVAKGPPADRAFDADGNPTKAAIGFARGKGVDVADLQIVEDGKKRYITAVVKENGQATVSILAQHMPDLLANIKFQRSMRWNESGVSFSRPLRWIVALYGPDIVRFSYAGLQSGRMSHGLRPYGSLLLAIDDAGDYLVKMRKASITLSTDARKERIMNIAAKLVAEKQCVLKDDPALLAEVANLVERPTPLRGRFDERFLALPEEALVAVMKKHQRYFPVYRDGKLAPYFIAVRNGDEKHLDIVTAGNEHVIRARFADVEFFYNNDVKKKLSDFLPELDKLTFQFKLGSMLDKTRRLEKLTPIVAGMIGLTDAETQTANRAAALAKADLASSLVVEMTSLQGTMGSHYAKLSGETDAVAEAIAEQYNAVSATRAGMALAIADRLDSLMGLFAAGLAPKGSNDPFALRRAALHIIENLIANEQSFDIRKGLQAAANLLPLDCDAAAIEKTMAFVNGRLESSFRDKGYPTGVVKAVLAEQSHNPYAANKTAVALAAIVQEESWEPLLDSYARCVRITAKIEDRHALRPDAFTLDQEKALLAAYETAVGDADGTINQFARSLGQLLPAINDFFDGVMVMDNDQALRENRLALLQHIAALTDGIADLSYLEGF